MSRSTSSSSVPFVTLLVQDKDALIKKWIERIAASYPDDTTKFLLNKKDQFQNPVGHTLSTEIAHIYDELLRDHHTDRLTEFVDAIVRIRAVQDYTPSGAVAIFYLLKDVVRENLWARAAEQGLIGELLAFERKIDQLSLHAFDLYMKCREKIWELKAKEVQQRTKNLLKRANVVWEFLDEEGKELKPVGGVKTPRNAQ